MAEKQGAIITPTARLSYPNLFKARANDQGKMQFSCALIFDKAAQATPEYAAMQARAQEVAIAFFGVDEIKRLKDIQKFKWPFRRAEEKAGSDGYEPGFTFMNCNTTMKPQIVMPNGVDLVEDESFVYAGMYVRASLSCFGYNKKGTGVSFGLNNMQIVREGPSISGRSRATDEFSAISADVASVGAVESLFN